MVQALQTNCTLVTAVQDFYRIFFPVLSWWQVDFCMLVMPEMYVSLQCAVSLPHSLYNLVVSGFETMIACM